MAFHPDITRKDDVTLAMDTANAAVRIASRQLTGNAGTVEIPNADGTSTIMGVGAGDTTVAKFVGDTTAPGKPLGITAESHNGAVWVSWDGTLDGGIPADFDHVRFTAVDGSKTVDMGQLTVAGKVTAAELTAGDTVTITAIAYDDAHAADGSSTPNASVQSDPVTVVVQSAVDASAIQKAQNNAQSALDKAGQAADTATTAKTTADGANTAASNAQATATSADKAAQSAQTIANNAKATSAEAKQAAIDAQTAATNANTAADTAKKAAANANSAATSATTKADDASSAATQAQSTATAAAQAATSAQTAANLAIANAENYVKNPQFHGSNLDSVGRTQMDASDSNAGTLPAAASTYGKNTGGYDCIADAVRIRAIAGHTYRIEIDSKPASDMPSTETEPFGLMYWRMSADNPGITADQFTMINTTATTVTDWTHSKMEFTYAGTESWSVFRPAYRAKPAQKWLVTNFTCTDITDAKAAQDAAATAQTAADNAAIAAANAASIANTAKAAAQGAQTTADGKNKIFSAATQPSSRGLVPGDLWFQLNSSNHVTGIQTWNGSKFVDYLVVANEILVAGSVGTTQIKNGAITTDLLTSNAVTAIKIAAQTITGDKLNVGSVASAIMTSNLFKTSGTSNYTIVNDSGITVYKNGKPYSHMGSDTAYGLQLWNPYTSSMVEASSMVFGITPFISASQKNIVPPGNNGGFNGWTFEDLPNTFTAPSPRAFGIFSYATALNDDVCAVNCAAILRYNGSDIYAWNSNPKGYVALNGNTLTYMFDDLVVGRTYNVRFQWRGARMVHGDRNSNVATVNRSLVLFPS